MALVFEALDKACDVSRDYLIAPTATGTAPLMTVVPERYREFVMAIVFIVVLFAMKGIYHHHKRLQALREQQNPPGRHSA